MGELKIEIIKSIDKFKSLKSEWNWLLGNSKVDNFFLTWEWLYTWWGVFGKESDLFILVYRNEKDVIQGILPLYIKKRRPLLYPFLIKELRFIGSGGDISSEYLDFICYSGLEREIIPKFLDLIFNKKCQWDVLVLNDVNQDSENIKYIRRSLFNKNKYSLIKEEKAFCPTIKFNGNDTWELFCKSLNKSLRHNIRRWRRRINADFKVSFYTHSSLSKLDGLFDKFIELHGLRREQKNGISRFVNKDYSEFHRNLIPLISQNNWLNFNVLQLNSEIVAIKYNFQYKNKIYSYQGGWDPHYSKYDIGQVIFTYILEDSIKKGISEVDLLRGEEVHKLRWANRINRKNNIVISNSKTGDLYINFCRTKNICLQIAKLFLPRKLREKIKKKLKL